MIPSGKFLPVAMRIALRGTVSRGGVAESQTASRIVRHSRDKRFPAVPPVQFSFQPVSLSQDFLQLSAVSLKAGSAI